MRKIALLTTTALMSAALLGGQKLTVDAAAGGKQFCVNGAQIIIAGVSPNLQNITGIPDNSCDFNSLLENLLECLPTQRPCPPAQEPDNNTPDVNDTPGAVTPGEKPDTETPETGTPDSSTPGTDTPETDQPATGKPDSSTPETDTPEADQPATGKPDFGQPNAPETDNPATETPDTYVENQAYIDQVVKLVNIERARAGLAPLSVDLKVQAAAQVRALEIEKSFSHTRPNGASFSTALREQNVTYRSAGENIAWGQRSPEDVVNAWMNSDGHRANILNANFTKIGVGYHQNTRGVNYWSQLFIR